MSAPTYARTLAILSFHKIGAPSDHEWDTWFYIPEKVFIDQLEWLRKNDWDVIGIHGFLRGLSDPGSLHEHSVLLTFDDGYQSIPTIALPCLQRFGYPAVVFVPTDYIGGTNSFDLDNEPVERICSWDELRRLEAGGVTVQSHGVTHRTFSELSPDDQREEVEHSKSILEQGLQTTVSAFAFPFGDGGASETVTPMVAIAGYRAAFLYGTNSVYLPERLPVCDAYRLDRVAMGRDTDLGGILGEAAVRSTS